MQEFNKFTFDEMLWLFTCGFFPRKMIIESQFWLLISTYCLTKFTIFENLNSKSQINVDPGSLEAGMKTFVIVEKFLLFMVSYTPIDVDYLKE